jgi:hypothetical protein
MDPCREKTEVTVGVNKPEREEEREGVREMCLLTLMLMARTRRPGTLHDRRNQR